MEKKKLFVASTGKNVGKTTVSLGLLSGLKDHFSKLGFLKPVGQQWVEAEGGLKVDKDIVLFKDTFQIDTAPEKMSPVLLPKEFTRQYLDGKIDVSQLKSQMVDAFSSIEKAKDFTLVEGTGHVGVGSIINLNNAQVAKLLDTPVILVCPGGIGSSFDQIALNVALCKHNGVKVIGVILNKVKEEKIEMIKSYMQVALKQLDLPLLGVIPFNPLLSTPTLKDFETLFKSELIAGFDDRLHHFKKVSMAASSVDVFEKMIASDQLIITHSAREDVILACLAKYLSKKEVNHPIKLAMILTGRGPRPPIAEQIKKANLPCLTSKIDSFETMQKISNYTAKIGRDDQEKISKAIQVVKSSLDFETLVQKL